MQTRVRSLGANDNRRLQFRWETYTTFNHTQYTAVDSTARFDANNNQINGNLGYFTNTALGRRMVLALKFYFLGVLDMSGCGTGQN